MSPSLRALLWETWQIGLREMLTRASVLLALVLFLATGIVQRTVGTGPGELVIRSVVILIVMEICIASSLAWRALDVASQVGLGSLFVRPVTTRAIVAVRFGYTVGVNVVFFVMTGLALQQVFSPEFPILGGAAIVALCSAIFVCLLWSPATQPGRGLGAMLGILIIGFVFAALNARCELDQPFVMAAGAPQFFRLDVALAVVTVGGVGLAFATTCASVAVQRSGEMLGWEKWLGNSFSWCWGRLARNKSPSGVTGSAELRVKQTLEPFLSEERAQYWCEFRTHGIPVVVLASIISALGLLGLGSTVLLNPQTHFDVLWFVALFLCPFAFQLISADGASNVKANNGTAGYNPFYGTLPLSNQQLVRIKLISIALHTTLGFLIVLGAAVLHFSLFGWARIEGVWPALAKLTEQTTAIWWITAVVAFVWTYVSSSGMTLSVGYFITLHPKRFWLIAGAMYFHAIPVVLLAAEGWPYLEYWAYYAYLLAAGILAFGCWSIWCCLKEHQLSPPMLAVGASAWGVYMLGMAYVFKTSGALDSLPTAIVALGISLLAVPLIGLLTVSASLARNRHA